MPLVAWSESLFVGVGQIDSEHERLVEMLNEMYDAIIAVRGQDALAEITGRMLDYAYEHFEHEEQLMIDSSYDSYLSHKAAHASFLDKSRSVADRMAAGDFVSSVEILKFLKGWLVDHILGVDTQFARTLGGSK